MKAGAADEARLAIEGGTPIRCGTLPYGRQWLDEDDIAAVTTVLRSDWLTTGPVVEEFERAFAQFCGTREAVAVSSGTAALHAAMHALKIGPGDEVLVPTLTFAASANCVVYQGATPVFCDVAPDTLLLDPQDVERKITSRTRAIIAVDYAGQPCEYRVLEKLAKRFGLALVADACHALGGSDHNRPVGSLADLSTFSLHPVKPITSGEGGVITTDDTQQARRMRAFRSHGIESDHRSREASGSWFYEMTELGFNYRLSDVQCALAKSQLKKLPVWVERRQHIARLYDEAFRDLAVIHPLAVQPLRTRPEVSHARHLYVVRLDKEQWKVGRGEVLKALRAEGIGVNVHYVPVHLHPFYQQRFGTAAGDCPVAENAYEQILSLPIFPRMSDEDAHDVIKAFRKVFQHYACA